MKAVSQGVRGGSKLTLKTLKSQHRACAKELARKAKEVTVTVQDKDAGGQAFEEMDVDVIGSMHGRHNSMLVSPAHVNCNHEEHNDEYQEQHLAMPKGKSPSPLSPLSTNTEEERP